MKSDYLDNDELDSDNNGEIPELSKLKRENPFKVPDYYFDSLIENVQQKISALPDLEKLNKENPFVVPEGYFDSLPTAIQQRITDRKNNHRVYREWFSTLLRPSYLALASIIILALFGINYLTKPIVIFTSDHYLSYDEIIGSSCICDIDESTFVDVIEKEQFMSTVSNEDIGIEQYLLENNIDPSQLEIQL